MNVYTPSRGWRRLTATVRRWWRRAWGVDLDHLADDWQTLDHLADDWQTLGYLTDDGVEPFVATGKIDGYLATMDSAIRELAALSPYEHEIAERGDIAAIWRDPEPGRGAHRAEALRTLAGGLSMSAAKLRRWYGCPPLHRDDTRRVDGAIVTRDAAVRRILAGLPRPAHRAPKHRSSRSVDYPHALHYRVVPFPAYGYPAGVRAYGYPTWGIAPRPPQHRQETP